MSEADLLDREALNVDHWVPLSHGGPNVAGNLRLTHKPCNHAKGCGCPRQPDGSVDHGRPYRERLWKAQDHRCGEAGDPINPSDVNDEKVTRVVDEKLSHWSCLYEAAVARGARTLQPPPV